MSFQIKFLISLVIGFSILILFAPIDIGHISDFAFYGVMAPMLIFSSVPLIRIFWGNLSKRK